MLRVKRFKEFFIGVVNRDTYALMNAFDALISVKNINSRIKVKIFF